MNRRPAALIVIVLAVAALWYSQAPPRTPDAYEKEVSRTVTLLRSQLRTAQEWAMQVDQSKAPLTTATVGFAEVELDATRTADRFAAYQPPEGQDRLRSRVTSVGGDVVSALAQIRIAARRGSSEAVVAGAQKLKSLDERLTRIDLGVSS